MDPGDSLRPTPTGASWDQATTPRSATGTGAPAIQPLGGTAADHAGLSSDIQDVRRRVFRQSRLAIDMLERALDAFWKADHAASEAVLSNDDTVDAEEVRIENECLRVLEFGHPTGLAFREVVFCLRVNWHLERVADHATSIAALVRGMPSGRPPAWPQALVELGDRVISASHELMRSALQADAVRARKSVRADALLDRLHRRSINEILSQAESGRLPPTAVVMTHRACRELERIGDLMANIGEEVIYLETGRIVRHDQCDDQNNDARDDHRDD